MTTSPCCSECRRRRNGRTIYPDPISSPAARQRFSRTRTSCSPLSHSAVASHGLTVSIRTPAVPIVDVRHDSAGEPRGALHVSCSFQRPGFKINANRGHVGGGDPASNLRRCQYQFAVLSIFCTSLRFRLRPKQRVLRRSTPASGQCQQSADTKSLKHQPRDEHRCGSLAVPCLYTAPPAAPPAVSCFRTCEWGVSRHRNR